MKTLQVAILGLGQIGMGYDYQASDSNIALTHATAFNQHPAFELIGGVDPDESQRAKFNRKFGVDSFSNMSELFDKHQPEVVVISTPSHLHYEHFNEILLKNSATRIIVCEKPLAINVKTAHEMVKHAAERNITLAVNYFRRFEPGFLLLKKMIEEKHLGTVNKLIVNYGKGFKHNASHYLDLLLFILGDLISFTIISPGRDLQDDAEPDVNIKFANQIGAYFIAHKEENFSMGEIRFYCEKGVIVSSREAGIQVFPVTADPVFPGYTILPKTGQAIDTDIGRCQWHMVEHLHQHWQDKTQLNSSGESALKTLEYVEQILQQRRVVCHPI